MESLHLDLYNFEDPGTEGSRYVLTSPRSLEACSRFGIQPVELLAKHLSDFQRGGYSDRQSEYAVRDDALEQFQAFERQRLRKLRLCREERGRIIDEQEREKREKTGYYRVDSWKPKSYTDTNHSQNGDSYGTKARSSYQSSHGYREEKSPMPSSPYSSHGWSSGYVSGLAHNLMQRTYGETSAHLNRSDDFRPSSPTDSIKSTPVKGRDSHRRHRESRDPWRWQNEDEGCVSDHEVTVRKRSGFSDRSRNASLASLSSILPPHLVKSLSQLSETDEKLLHVMLNKVKDEKQEKERRMCAELEWMEEKKLQNELQETKERQHRMLMADKVRERDYQRELMKRKQSLKEEEDRRYREAMIRSKEDLWSREFQKQTDAKNAKAAMKKAADHEKRHSQQQNLTRAEREKEARRNVTRSSLVDRQREALRNKELRVSQERLKKQWQNTHEKERYEMRREEIDKQDREEEVMRRHAMQEKHIRAEGNLKKQIRQREAEISELRYRSQTKKELQEDHVRKMEEDLTLWQEELKELQSTNHERAIKQAQRVIDERSQRVHEQRKIREEDYAMNRARVEKDQQYKQHELKEIINMKDQKSRFILDDREDTVRRSRDTARASRAIRDAIREQAIKSSFDRMAEEGQRLARMERGGSTRRYENKSSSFW